MTPPAAARTGRNLSLNGAPTMTIINLLATLGCLLERRIERDQQQRDEAYLAQATDHADLERRQRELARPQPLIPQYS